MFDTLSKIFGLKADEQSANEWPMTRELAVAALLVHLASIDGDFDDAELARINQTLKSHFDLDEKEVDELVERARITDEEAVDFYQFTSLITQMEMEERIEIIRMMWQVVFTDDHNHELEDNMVWRVAELIGVSARDRTSLRAQIRKEQTD